MEREVAAQGAAAVWEIEAMVEAGRGSSILKRDNSDPDAASELHPRCRGWICGARAGVGLRNGGRNYARWQKRAFDG